MKNVVWAKQEITEYLATYAAASDDVQQLLDLLYLMLINPLHMGFAAAVATSQLLRASCLAVGIKYLRDAML
jgi:hypothetical protein